MKIILYLPTLLAVVFHQNTLIASAYDSGISDKEFTSLVCSNLYEIEDKAEALDNVKATLGSNISTSQLEKLEKIASSQEFTRDFCLSNITRF